MQPGSLRRATVSSAQPEWRPNTHRSYAITQTQRCPGACNAQEPLPDSRVLSLGMLFSVFSPSLCGLCDSLCSRSGE
jgi:hypothetical protein